MNDCLEVEDSVIVVVGGVVVLNDCMMVRSVVGYEESMRMVVTLV